MTDTDHMADQSPIAQNLERLIAEKGTNASALAKRAGLNHTAARDIITGKAKHPTLRVLRQLADALGVEVAAIMHRPDETPDYRPLSGMAESTVAPWEGPTSPAQADTDRLAAALMPGARTPEAFVAKATAVGFGIVKGDILLADMARTARAGDLVIATLVDLETGDAATVLRLFAPPFLISCEPDASEPAIRLDMSGRAAILGTVAATVRQYRSEGTNG